MNEGENCNIFLTFNNIISRPRLHYYIDSRSIGDPMDRSRFPERLSGSWPASARPAATFFGHGDRSHGEITAIYGRQQVPSQMPPHLSRNFSDATWQGRYVLARPLLSRRSCDSFRSLFCLLLLRFISPDVRTSRVAGEIRRPPELFPRETRGTLFYRQSRLRPRFLPRLCIFTHLHFLNNRYSLYLLLGLKEWWCYVL